MLSPGGEGSGISLKWRQLCPPLGVVDTVLSADRQMQFCHESGGLVGAGDWEGGSGGVNARAEGCHRAAPSFFCATQVRAE